MDGRLAVIGLGSIGSTALWQASRLSDSVVGFEAQTPAHTRSAAGGDTRLFRIPENLGAKTETRRLFLSWFLAGEASEFSPGRFPDFIRISGNRSMYGAPSVDGVRSDALPPFDDLEFLRPRRFGS